MSDNFVIVTTRATKAWVAIGTLRQAFTAMAATLPEKASQMAVSEAKSTTLFGGTGRTKSTIKASQVGTYRWRFIAGGASPYLNYGTGESGPKHAKYPITTKRPGGLLRFEWHGVEVLAKKVMHPGVQPTRFVDHAVNEAKFIMMSRLSVELDQMIRAHNQG